MREDMHSDLQRVRNEARDQVRGECQWREQSRGITVEDVGSICEAYIPTHVHAHLGLQAKAAAREELLRQAREGGLQGAELYTSRTLRRRVQELNGQWAEMGSGFVCVCGRGGGGELALLPAQQTVTVLMARAHAGDDVSPTKAGMRFK